MPSVHRGHVLETLRARFSELRKLAHSQSLFSIGDDAARVYLRYSKVHDRGRAFFGLREVDLCQLDGHNSFICFVLDDRSPPLFIPYRDFEEVFRAARTASDGQYKVYMYFQREALELAVAGQGRFNVEGYVGFDALRASLDSRRLRQARELSHSQVQTLLAAIGSMKGYDVSIAEYDVGKIAWSLTSRFRLRRSLPQVLDDVKPILSEIDVLWLAPGRNALEGLFEPVFSGLLRLNDILLTYPQVPRFSIVSNETKRIVFARQIVRPTFRQSGLADRVNFLEYANVFEWHARLAEGGRR
jgi:hypothetical protein